MAPDGRGRPVPRAAHPRRAVSARLERSIAADGPRRARVARATCVEEHLAAIAARDAELHAFNLVLADEARDAADAVDAAVGARRGSRARSPASRSR